MFAIPVEPQRAVAMQPQGSTRSLEKVRRSFEEPIKSLDFKIGRQKTSAATLTITEREGGKYCGIVTMHRRGILPNLKKMLARGIATLGQEIGIMPTDYAGTVIVKAYSSQARSEVVRQWPHIEGLVRIIGAPKGAFVYDPITDSSEPMMID